MDRIDLTGERFGRLLVIAECESVITHTPHRTKRKRMWLCQCDCGNQCVASMDSLRSGHKKSCGCLYSENIERQIKNRTKHNDSKSRLYTIWSSMKRRTSNPKSDNYVRYGGRGISVCDEWASSYEAFKDWAISHGYDETLTIDRIDNDGDYEPNNCRWVTNMEQAYNRSSNRRITYHGDTHTITEWAKITGINKTTLRDRLEYGWSVEDALTISPELYKHRAVHDG